MAPAVYLIASPLFSFLILLLFGAHFKKAFVSIVGVVGILFSALYALYLFYLSFSYPAANQPLWTFLSSDITANSSIIFGLNVDSLSLTMALVVSFVSFWIALYSTEYMAKEEGLRRFFAVVNLFVAFMLLIVLADNLVLLFFGWEGVGLCSYLLIGFYYQEPKAEAAAMKAFLTTRIGDIFLLLGMLLCFFTFNTLDINAIISQAQMLFPSGTWVVHIIALCFLGGAVGKSAQLPLQTWLADAMWGPTPVSALIHAATMVTAGVYLIARFAGLFALSAGLGQIAILVVAGLTLILAGFAACAQTDLKRVLAYSTMSQIGYMFLALGVGAYQAAIFHLVTHAFFKALLFLCAGVIGHALHTYDMRQMGGLRRQMPTTFVLFLIGAASLVGLPFVSAGFFSKEWIMSQVFISSAGGNLAFYAGVFGSFLTGLYTMRMIVMTFFGEARSKALDHSGIRIFAPLFVLALFSVAIGFLETPVVFGHIDLISRYLSLTLPKSPVFVENLFWLFLPTMAASVGVVLAIFLYGKLQLHRSSQSIFTQNVVNFTKSGLGFDDTYQHILVKPYTALARVLKIDVTDKIISFITAIIVGIIAFFDRLHTGRLTHYVSFLIVAALSLASIMVYR